MAEGRIDAVQGMAGWELGAAGDGLVVGEERSDGNGGAALGSWCVGRHWSTEAWGILGAGLPPD